MIVRFLGVLLLVGTTACGAAHDRGGPDPGGESLPPLEQGAAETLLRDGQQLLAAGSYREASALFDRVADSADVAVDRRILALAGSFLAWHLDGDLDEERRAAGRFYRLQMGGGTSDARLPPNAAGELRWLRAVALRVVAAGDAERRLSVGAGPRNPIPVLAPSEAGETARWIRCGPRLRGRYTILKRQQRRVRGTEYEVLHLGCDSGPGRRSMWFDLSLWYAFTATHLDGAPPPMGFTRQDAARVVLAEFGKEPR